MGAGVPHSTDFPWGIRCLLQAGTRLGPVLAQRAIIKCQEEEGGLDVVANKVVQPCDWGLTT